MGDLARRVRGAQPFGPLGFRALGHRGALVHARQEQHERAAGARLAGQLDLAAEQLRDLAADRQAEPGPPEPAARRPVRLLERLEDDPVLVGRDADAGVGDAEGDHLRRSGQQRLVGAPPRRRDLDRQLHASFLGELERVRDQVLQHLLQPLRVCLNRGRQTGLQAHVEPEPLVDSHLFERALDVVL